MVLLYPAALLAISIGFAIAERLRPWRPAQAQLRRTLPSDLAHLIFNGHFLGVILYGLANRFVLPPLDRALPPNVEAVLHRGLASSWPWWVQVPIALVVLDFVQWCIHNALHRVPLLWELHKTHHSVVDGEMDWIVSFRFQWTEVVVYKAVQYLPLAFFGFGTPAILFHAIFGTLIGHLNHSNLDLGHGRWRYVLNNPRMHIWHHDYGGDAGRAVNFGIIFSLWDWIFGTARIPGPRPERLGFPGVERFPSSFLSQTAWPIPALLGRGRRGQVAAALAGAALIGAGGWLSTAPAIAGGPLLGEHAASSQPSGAGRSGFPYAATAEEADRALLAFGQDAALLGFAHPEDQVGADELARALGSPRLLVIDVRPEERFAKGHVPGARQAWRGDYSAREPIPGLSRDVPDLERWLRSIGARQGATLVLYGDGGPEPYRLWWTLLTLGGLSTRVLDGGLEAWKIAGHPLAEGRPPAIAAGDLELVPPANPPPRIWRAVAPVIEAGAALIDTRTEGEYLGSAQHEDAARAGRIPGALHLDWLELFRGAADPRLKLPEDLRAAFAAHAIDLDRAMVLSCQSGTRSAAAYFALHQLGVPSSRLVNYEGSWAEYSRLPLPAAVGPESRPR